MNLFSLDTELLLTFALSFLTKCACIFVSLYYGETEKIDILEIFKVIGLLSFSTFIGLIVGVFIVVTPRANFGNILLFSPLIILVLISLFDIAVLKLTNYYHFFKRYNVVFLINLLSMSLFLGIIYIKHELPLIKRVQ